MLFAQALYLVACTPNPLPPHIRRLRDILLREWRCVRGELDGRPATRKGNSGVLSTTIITSRAHGGTILVHHMFVTAACASQVPFSHLRRRHPLTAPLSIPPLHAQGKHYTLLGDCFDCIWKNDVIHDRRARYNIPFYHSLLQATALSMISSNHKSPHTHTHTHPSHPCPGSATPMALTTSVSTWRGRSLERVHTTTRMGTLKKVRAVVVVVV